MLPNVQNIQKKVIEQRLIKEWNRNKRRKRIGEDGIEIIIWYQYGGFGFCMCFSDDQFFYIARLLFGIN